MLGQSTSQLSAITLFPPSLPFSHGPRCLPTASHTPSRGGGFQDLPKESAGPKPVCPSLQSHPYFGNYYSFFPPPSLPFLPPFLQSVLNGVCLPHPCFPPPIPSCLPFIDFLDACPVSFSCLSYKSAPGASQARQARVKSAQAQVRRARREPKARQARVKSAPGASQARQARVKSAPGASQTPQARNRSTPGACQKRATRK